MSNIGALKTLAPKPHLGTTNGEILYRRAVEAQAPIGIRSDEPQKTKSTENYVAELERRKYFEPGGAVRDTWIVSTAQTVNKAWEDADDKALAIEPSDSMRDYEVDTVRQFLMGVKTTSKVELLKQRAVNAIRKGLSEIPNLPPDTRTTAISDATMLIKLLDLSEAGVKDLGGYLDIMNKCDEVWRSGYGRYTIAKGKFIAYGMKQPENVVAMA